MEGKNMQGRGIRSAEAAGGSLLKKVTRKGLWREGDVSLSGEQQMQSLVFSRKSSRTVFLEETIGERSSCRWWGWRVVNFCCWWFYWTSSAIFRRVYKRVTLRWILRPDKVHGSSWDLWFLVAARTHFTLTRQVPSISTPLGEKQWNAKFISRSLKYKLYDSKWLYMFFSSFPS